MASTSPRNAPMNSPRFEKNPNDERILEDLHRQLQNIQFPAENLSALARNGSDKLVEEFLSNSVSLHGADGTSAIQSQLYLASFWGFKDIVRRLMEKGADVNHQSRGTQWTPLHAATFQEQGPVVMMLLEAGAEPDRRDYEGRTPRDFASASDKIWPLFAVLNLARTVKSELIAKGIIRKIDPQQETFMSRQESAGIKMAAYSRPDSAYAVNNNVFNGGDVLAEEADPEAGRSRDVKINIWNR